MYMAVNDPERFVQDQCCTNVFQEHLAQSVGISTESVAVVLHRLIARRLDGEQPRWGGVAADYTITPSALSGSGSTDSLVTNLTRMTSPQFTTLVGFRLEQRVGKGVYTVKVTEAFVLTRASMSLAGPRVGIPMAAAALAIFLAGRA